MKKHLVLILLAFLLKDPAMAKAKIIDLPAADKSGRTSVEEALEKRRSVRSFQDRPLTIEQVGQLFWAGQGVTGGQTGFEFRASPSAGALYPIELYLVSGDKVLRYIPDGHKAELMKTGDHRRRLAEAALGQSAVSAAPASMVVCAVFKRVTRKYGERGINYCYMEAGHVAQNIHLQCVSLGLVSVPIGAFDAEDVQRALRLPPDHEPLYIIPLGLPQQP